MQQETTTATTLTRPTTIYQLMSLEGKRRMDLKLLKAGKDGSLKGIIECINQGVPIGTVDMNCQDTVSHYASCYGYLDIVKYITQTCHVDVNTMKNFFRQTALQYNVNIQDRDGWTVLHVASHMGHIEIVQHLTQQCKANVETEDNERATALNRACCGTTVSLDIVKFLIKECNANVDARTLNGWTPLHTALCCGNISIAQYLIDDCHADITATTTDGENVFDIAYRSNQHHHIDAMVYLLRTIRVYGNNM